MVHQDCHSRFCNDCITTFMQSTRNAVCPVCRGPLESLMSDAAADTAILSTSHQCDCGQTMLLSEYNAHTNACPALKQAVKQGVANAPKAKEPVVNRSTFSCPHCEAQHMSRETLLTHYSERHSQMPGVCPICVAMPWGDPNFVSQDLEGHLHTRHQYDTDTYTDYAMEDDEILQMILQESRNCY